MGRWLHGPARACLALAVLTMAAGVAAPRPAQAQFFWQQPRFSPDDAALVAIRHGFRVLSRPVRNNDVYVAQVIDRRGGRAQLIIGADSGRIVQRVYVDAERTDGFYRDPTIPPGPLPPGRIPRQERHRNEGFFARLFGDDTPDAGESVERPRPSYGDRPLYNSPDQPVRTPRARRQSRIETAPETIRREPVESAPLAPPPSLPRTAAPPRAAPAAKAPAEASLPAPSAPASPPATTPPGRAISSNPLAIPGSREQDERATQTIRSPAKPAAPAPVKPETPQVPVAVAPLE